VLKPPIPWARPLLQDIALGDFPFCFSVHYREGEREKRGGGGRGKRNQRARRHRVALLESGTLKLEPDEWQRRPSTHGWRPKQRSSSRHHLHHAVAAVNFTTADSTATSSPPPQREPLRVLLLTLLTTQGGVPQCHAAPAAALCAELSSPFSPCPAFAPLFSCRIPSPFRRRAPQHASAGRRPLPHLNPFRRGMTERRRAGCLLVCMHRHWRRFGLQLCGCRCVRQGAHPHEFRCHAA
jgi:hypothetical protein